MTSNYININNMLTLFLISTTCTYKIEFEKFPYDVCDFRAKLFFLNVQHGLQPK